MCQPRPACSGRPPRLLLTATSEQVQRVCPPLAHLKSVGVEVAYLHCPGTVQHSARWSPDGSALAHVLVSTTDDPADTALLLCDLDSGRQVRVVPPVTPVFSSNVAWAPSSRLLLSITGAHASFVERRSGAARMQHTSLPQRLVTHCVTVGSAGFLAVAQFGEQHGVVSVCSLAGAPQELVVLRQVTTGRATLSLAMSPCGLLCGFIACGSRFGQPWSSDEEGFLVDAQRPFVQVCELTTGRCATVQRTRPSTFEWLPVPTSPASFRAGVQEESGLGLSWEASGRGLFITVLATKRRKDGRTAHRLSFLP